MSRGQCCVRPRSPFPPGSPLQRHRDQPHFTEGKTEAQGGAAACGCSARCWVPRAGGTPRPPAAEPAAGAGPRAGPFRPLQVAGAPPGLGVPAGDSEEMVSSLTSCARPPARASAPPASPSARRARSPPRSPSHSNSWRRRPPSRPSPRSPCRRRPSSRSIAASCRSSTTRTG